MLFPPWVSALAVDRGGRQEVQPSAVGTHKEPAQNPEHHPPDLESQCSCEK